MFGRKNAAFKKWGIMLLVIGFLCYYLFCAVTGEQINFLTTTLLEETGWTITAVTRTLTWGSLAAVVMVFVINTLFMRINTKRLMVCATFIVAVGIAVIGISSAVPSMAAFVVAWIVVRLVIVILQHGTNFACQNWWSKNRGKALGIVTIGGPAASATFVLIMTAGLKSGMKFAGVYYVFAGCIAVIGLLMIFFFKGNPESCGLYPDGADKPPQTSEEEPDKSAMTIREVLKHRDTWILIVSFGILSFGIGCITAYFVTVMVTNNVPSSIYLPALSIGAIAGIFVSFGLGIIDDKWGTPVASIVMCVFYIIGFLGMAFSAPASFGAIAMATVGYAAITGGCPNLNSSINTYVFGRRNYLAVSRVVMTAQCIIGAFSNMYMGAFLNAGNPKGAYFILCGAVVVAAILLVILARKPAYDSEEAVRAREAAGGRGDDDVSRRGE